MDEHIEILEIQSAAFDELLRRIYRGEVNIIEAASDEEFEKLVNISRENGSPDK